MLASCEPKFPPRIGSAGIFHQTAFFAKCNIAWSPQRRSQLAVSSLVFLGQAASFHREVRRLDLSAMFCVLWSISCLRERASSGEHWECHLQVLNAKTMNAFATEKRQKDQNCSFLITHIWCYDGHSSWITSLWRNVDVIRDKMHIATNIFIATTI